MLDGPGRCGLEPGRRDGAGHGGCRTCRGRPFAGGRPRSAAGARCGLSSPQSRRPCAPPACGAWRAGTGGRALVGRRVTAALIGLADGPAGRCVALPQAGRRLGRAAWCRCGGRPAARLRAGGPAAAPGEDRELAFCSGSYRAELCRCQVRSRRGGSLDRPGRSARVRAAAPRAPGRALRPAGRRRKHDRASVSGRSCGAGRGAARALVIEVDGRVAWVAGRVAESFRVSESTVFTLHVRREDR